MGAGGKRKGAGMPKGKVLPKTLQKMAVAAEINQRTMRHADQLWNAQYQKAVGSVMVFRIDEFTDENGKIKKEHVHITDPDEIKQFLDNCEGCNGYSGDKYYFITEILPDSKTIDSMFDRAFGKAPQSIEITDETSQKWRQAIQQLIESKAAKDESEAALLLESVGFAVKELGNVG